MKQVIICEGKTDGILISYFLGKFGWKYLKNPILKLPDHPGSETNWYQHPEKPGQELVIWSVGGISIISTAISNIVERTANERDDKKRFKKMVVFIDMDESNELERLRLIESGFSGYVSGIRLTNTEWGNVGIYLNNQRVDAHTLAVLPIVIPPGSQGNLETFLVECLARQNDVQKELVEKSRKFIADLTDDVFRIKSHRYKALLSVILSVISPTMVFAVIHEKLVCVPWEEMNEVSQIYNELLNL